MHTVRTYVKVGARENDTQKISSAMPAPTAAASTAVSHIETQNTMEIIEEESTSMENDSALLTVMINPTETAIPLNAPSTDQMHIDEESRPHFPPSTQQVVPPPP
jgi:hypothetical protein